MCHPGTSRLVRALYAKSVEGAPGAVWNLGLGFDFRGLGRFAQALDVGSIPIACSKNPGSQAGH